VRVVGKAIRRRQRHIVDLAWLHANRKPSVALVWRWR
jgi:hypothetical protein